MNFYKTINNIIFLVTVFIIVLTKTANSIETQWQGINEAQVKLVLPLTSTNNQKIVLCCKLNESTEKKLKKCRRKDGKIFDLPRRFSKKKCRKPKGFTMRSSCAPYKNC